MTVRNAILCVDRVWENGGGGWVATGRWRVYLRFLGSFIGGPYPPQNDVALPTKSGARDLSSRKRAVALAKAWRACFGPELLISVDSTVYYEIAPDNTEHELVYR